ncbi:MAG: response regulator [Pseudomonadota bacterium]
MTDPRLIHVVDDDEAVRDSISFLLDTIDLRYETHESADAFLARFDPATTACLILDIRMPGMSGLDLQQHLLDAKQDAPIVFITGHGDIPMAVEAMRKGALDFIRKPFRDQELLDRIQEAMNVGEQRAAHRARAEEAGALVDSLTARERQVFERVASGQANKVIAIDLGISERTVEIHRSNVMQKTKSRSLADLVRLHLQLERMAESAEGATD